MRHFKQKIIDKCEHEDTRLLIKDISNCLCGDDESLQRIADDLELTRTKFIIDPDWEGNSIRILNVLKQLVYAIKNIPYSNR